jgi:ADP-heptose:LPS heptosyltransferase
MDPTGTRVLILKLGALGDVLRTTPVLRRLRAELKELEVSWVAGPGAMGLLEGNPLLDRGLPWSLETVLRLQAERFDWVISLDKAPEAAALATILKAGRKSGFGMDSWGRIAPLDEKSHYAVRLGLDDELKFRMNTKTYQQITFEQLGWDFRGEEYILPLSGRERTWAGERLQELGLSQGPPPVGLAVGAGPSFANKTWPPHRWAGLARRIIAQDGRPVLILVGPDELILGEKVLEGIGLEGAGLSGGDHDLKQIAALIERCEAVVSGDTLAMHLAIAVGTPVVALFGPTCAQEVELYGRGIKLVSPKPCAPCYRARCLDRPTCLEEIPEEHVMQALRSLPAPGEAKRAR